MSCSGNCACGGVQHSISIKPAYVNFCVLRGDPIVETVTIKERPAPDLPHELVDLTSPLRTYSGQLRKNVNSAEIIYTLDFDMTNAASGSFVFSIPKSITEQLVGEYHYDIEQNIDGNLMGSKTIISGTINFSPDVTRPV